MLAIHIIVDLAPLPMSFPSRERVLPEQQQAEHAAGLGFGSLMFLFMAYTNSYCSK